MKDIFKSNGIRQCLSSSYHPAWNGNAERAARTFKEAMKTMENKPGMLAEKLARFLLGYLTTPHTATSCMPVEILMGRRIRTWFDFLHPNLSTRMAEKTGNADQSTPLVFEIGEPVMVRDYQASQSKWTRGVIQDRIGPVTYRIQVGDLFWK